jgi:quinol monooxygenase YgiN
MPKTKPETAICTYRVKPGKAKAFMALLERHWPTLRRLDLVTPEPAVVYRGLPAGPGKEEHAAGPSTFVEIFSWKDAKAVDAAHHSPELLKIWEPMGQLCESMAFPHFERLDFGK